MSYPIRIQTKPKSPSERASERALHTRRAGGLSLYVCMPFPIHLSIHPPIHLSIYLSINQSINLYSHRDGRPNSMKGRMDAPSATAGAGAGADLSIL